MSDRVLQIVGGGRMGEALLGGLLAGGRAPESLAVAEVFAARREELSASYPGSPSPLQRWKRYWCHGQTTNSPSRMPLPSGPPT